MQRQEIRLLSLVFLGLILGWLPTIAVTAAMSTSAHSPLRNVTTATAQPIPMTLTDVMSATIPASKDNTLYQDNTGNKSNGAGAHLFAGRSGGSGADLIHRGLIAFDIASNVPAGHKILSVTLKLSMSRSQHSGVQPVRLRRVLRDWGEGTSDAPFEEGGGAPATIGDATWLHAVFTSTLWTTSGGDFADAESASTAVGNTGFYTWSTPHMAADVQMWLDTPASNFGWLLLGDESQPVTSKRFDTKENPEAAKRPVLIVEYALLPYSIYLPLVAK